MHCEKDAAQDKREFPLWIVGTPWLVPMLTWTSRLTRSLQEPDGEKRLLPGLTQYYQATAMVKDEGHPRVTKQQSAVYGSMQIATGLFSIGVGILSAVTQDITYSYMTMFRLSHLTGVLFLFVGIASNMLLKYPSLASLVFMANLGSIAVAIIAVCLISIDLAYWRHRDYYMRMEVVELLVLCFEVFLSVVLCFCFSKQKRAKSP